MRARRGERLPARGDIGAARWAWLEHGVLLKLLVGEGGRRRGLRPGWGDWGDQPAVLLSHATSERDGLGVRVSGKGNLLRPSEVLEEDSSSDMGSISASLKFSKLLGRRSLAALLLAGSISCSETGSGSSRQSPLAAFRSSPLFIPASASRLFTLGSSGRDGLLRLKPGNIRRGFRLGRSISSGTPSSSSAAATS